MSEDILNNEQLEVGSKSKNEEFELLPLIVLAVENKFKFIAISSLTFLMICLHFFLWPNLYKSDAMLLPEYASNDASQASSLLQQYGGLLGIANGFSMTNSNAIRVEIYPDIVKSTSFLYTVIHEQVYHSALDKEVSFFDLYASNERTFSIFENKDQNKDIKLDTTLLGVNNILYISDDEISAIETLRESVSTSINQETGIFSVSFTNSDALYSSLLTNFIVSELTSYITDYRVSKIRSDIVYVEGQLTESKKRFDEAQIRLADFADQNQNIISAKAEVEKQKLQSEYDIAFNVYNSLVQRYEESKLKLQEETPVFKALDEVKVPNKRINKSVINYSLLLFGVNIALLVYLLSNNYRVVLSNKYYEFIDNNPT